MVLLTIVFLGFVNQVITSTGAPHCRDSENCVPVPPKSPPDSPLWRTKVTPENFETPGWKGRFFGDDGFHLGGWKKLRTVYNYNNSAYDVYFNDISILAGGLDIFFHILEIIIPID